MNQNDNYGTIGSSFNMRKNISRTGRTRKHTRLSPNAGLILQLLEVIIILVCLFSPTWWTQYLSLPGLNVIKLNIGLFSVNASSNCNGNDSRTMKTIQRFANADVAMMNNLKKIGVNVGERDTIYTLVKNFCIHMVDKVNSKTLSEASIEFASNSWQVMISADAENLFTECSYLAMLFVGLFIVQIFSVLAAMAGAITWTFFQKTLQVRKFTFLSSLFGLAMFLITVICYVSIRPHATPNMFTFTYILGIEPGLPSALNFGASYILLAFLGIIKLSNLIFGLYFFWPTRECVDSTQFRAKGLNQKLKFIEAENNQYIKANIHTYGMQFAHHELAPKARALQKMYDGEYG